MLSAVIALSLPALASGQTDARGLQNALYGKQLGLRSYSADADAQYKWVNGGLVTGAVNLHGLEAFLTDSVTLKNGKIVIKGNRETLVRNGPDMATAGRTPMTLEVDLQGADPAVVIPQLQTALFFPHLQDAIAGLPKMVAQMLPYPINGHPKPPDDCSMTTQDGGMLCSEAAKTAANTTAPKLVKEAIPKYSQEARDNKISGVVTVFMHIKENGRVDEVWLLRPLGFGLDENAGNAARQYVFQPAMRDGKPVDVVMYVDVHFEIP